MLSYDQVRSLERALGPEAAPPLIEVLESISEQVKAELTGELATKGDIADVRTELRTEIAQVRTEIEKLRGELKEAIARLEGRFGKLELLMKVLIGLAIIGMAFFSPTGAEIIRLLR